MDEGQGSNQLDFRESKTGEEEFKKTALMGQSDRGPGATSLTSGPSRGLDLPEHFCEQFFCARERIGLETTLTSNKGNIANGIRAWHLY